MPWCPKCKTEYRNGITVCTDCGTTLVDELEEEVVFLPVMACLDKDLAHRFLDYLYYSNISSGKIEQNDITFEYSVSVTKEEFKQAKKLYSAFYEIEAEKNSKNKTEEFPDEEIASSTEKIEQMQNQKIADELRSPKNASTVYVRKEEKYQDIISTAYVFLLVGVLGIVFVVLNYVNIITFINGPFSYVLYSALFIGCLVASALSFRSAKEAKKQISTENSLTEKVNQWLKDTITKESLLSSHEEGLSDEVNFLNEMNYLKTLVCEEFPELDESYADTLCEEYYNEYLE
ncbi:hypothetical protein [Velocimicrobium porci]|uniref:Uncharacterized protein n=1 Tax=Velocimicrobium porci TaxID=2606634 RepID=A0A6L5XZ64_9FIRM|nr:hypothetical protein [Velocimicrobium porci]MSS64004.1 hypothetical protein [Velocimicrobium porci]